MKIAMVVLFITGVVAKAKFVRTAVANLSAIVAPNL
jgi:hypothetical protein